MILKKFEEVILADLEALVTDAVPESRTLDYKEALPDGTNDSVRAFLEDVVSFANASGGDIVFGLRDVRQNGQTTGVPAIAGLSPDMNEDDITKRIDSWIRDGIKPKIPTPHLKFIKGHAKGKLCLLRIPQSWAAPHMVTFKNRPAFFSRNNAGKFPLDVAEIRNAFTLATSVRDKIRDFRTDRTARVAAGDAAMVLADGPKVILSLVPVQSFNADVIVDLEPLNHDPNKAQPIYVVGGWSTRYNFDGLLNYATNDAGKGRSYVQFFRDGKIEAVTGNLLRPEMKGQIPHVAFEREIIRSLDSYLAVLRSFPVEPPVVVTLTLTDVRGAYISKGDLMEQISGRRDTIDRDILILPDLLVEDLATKAQHILRPVFDALWNACGYSKCFSYDADGNWFDQSRGRSI